MLRSKWLCKVLWAAKCVKLLRSKVFLLSKVFFEAKCASAKRYELFLLQCTKVRFASFMSGGFITVIVVNPPESKLAKRTSV